MNEPIQSDWKTDGRSIACAEREIAELKQQRDDLLAACEMALREWYPSLDGCADPDCLVCARHEKEKEQIKATIAKAKQ